MKFIITFRSKSLLITTVMILGLSIQTPAVAGNVTTYKPNDAYNSISAIPEVLFKRNLKQHDGSFAISPDAVLYKLKQKQKISLVDVRNPADFARLHIPGSLNIPLHAVKTKVFLKSFTIVLIDAGFHYSPLAAECRKLKDMGFKMFILDGGLPAWKRKGSRIGGDLFALEEMQVVSPHVFFQEKDFENTLVIDVSPVQAKISRQLMPYSNHIPVSVESGEWFRKLNRIIADHKNLPFLSVVVFNETADGYDRANKILAGLGTNAFYLQGGVAGYKEYLGNLLLSWLPRDSRIKTNRNCRACAKENEEKISTEICN
jgi:rhodanese-related sulfurtransferase